MLVLIPSILLYKQIHLRTASRVGSLTLKRVPHWRPKSSQKTDTPVSIDKNTVLTTFHQKLQRLILLRRTMYPQCYHLHFPTLRARPPARKGPYCPQNRVPLTGTSRLAQKKSSNASFKVVTTRLLVETMLGFISKHTMAETHFSAVNGTLNPPDFLISFTHKKIFSHKTYVYLGDLHSHAPCNTQGKELRTMCTKWYVHNCFLGHN